MSDTKFTPGPWHTDDSRKYTNIHSKIVSHIAKVPTHSSEGNANARLIAAAPDLLEAGNSLLAQLDQICQAHEIHSPTVEIAISEWKAALKKAGVE